jgi:hypothetical protein
MGMRCRYGNQFLLTAPKFTAYGAELWYQSWAASSTHAIHRTP